MGSYIMRMRNNLHQQSLGLQILYHSLAGLVAVHAEVLARNIDGRVIVHDVDLWQIVAFPILEVVRIMSWCDLHTAGTELFVYILICDHRDLTVGQRQF